MDFCKKTIVLNEVTGGFSKSSLRGVAVLERKGARVSIKLNIFGLESVKSGGFVLGVSSLGMRVQRFELGFGGRLASEHFLHPDTNLDSPVQVALMYCNETVIPVLFGSNGNKKCSAYEMLEAFTPLQNDYAPHETEQNEQEQAEDAEQIEEQEQPDRIQEIAELEKEETLRQDFKEEEVEMPSYLEPPKTLFDEDLINNYRAKSVKRSTKSQPQQSSTQNAAPPNQWSQQKESQPKTLSQPQPQRKPQPQPQPQPQPINVFGSFNILDEIETAADFQPTEYADMQVATENYFPPNYGKSEEFGVPRAETLSRASYEAAFSVEPDGASTNKIDPSKILFKQPLSFYQNVKSQIDELFNKYPREEELERRLRNTRWVKVDYNKNGKYYTVGLIGDEPKFIAYGVPAAYSAQPPEELAGCQWLPISDQNPEGDGYWVLYQDAETGNPLDVELI